MGIDIGIEMVDVLGRPLATDAEVTLELEDPSGVHPGTVHTNQKIIMSAPAPGTSRLTVTVKHPDYATQRVTVRIGSLPYYWDNPGCELVMTPTSAELKIVMGRVRQAPITATPFGGKTKGDQPGVFYQGGVGREPKQYAALGGFLTLSTPVRTLEDAVPPGGGAPSVLAGAAADGWDRFNFTKPDTPVVLSRSGGFIWLEYGSVTGARVTEPRFLIAVWAPALTDAVDGLDYVVFYSPSTATSDYPRASFPFRTNYPYTVFPANTMRQPYVDLAYRYLIINAVLAHASVASKKPPVIVMPIFPAVPDGKDSAKQMWQPFNSQEGVHRLLLEVTQFLHCFGYERGSTFSRWQGATAPEGNLPQVTMPPSFSSQNRPRPKIRHVTLAGFSSGISGLFPVIANAGLVSTMSYPPALFAADAGAFADLWREIWDLDFELNEKATGIQRAKLEKTLIDWRAGGRDRRLRMHHSGYTTGNARPAKLFPAFAALPKTVSAPPSAGAAWAEEWRDTAGHWSLAFYSTAYLQATTRPRDVQPLIPLVTDPPARRDAAVHPFTGAIAFGHAAKLRLV
ncbi:hypothetical protein NE236_34205 [Actinoallomurus purpureus]|uniref:hypothetical protein n=1 Tax=Actinoallomurus purpureus TaxID=478114 RepID=UPI002093FCDD|nr:hypothetical protein [Actinoallomurus purpureus]MCO6010036.1 hypothetical protein [Actinoallomurus purpureus]